MDQLYAQEGDMKRRYREPVLATGFSELEVSDLRHCTPDRPFIGEKGQAASGEAVFSSTHVLAECTEPS